MTTLDLMRRVLTIVEQTPTHDAVTDKQYRAYRFKKDVQGRLERLRDELVRGEPTKETE